MKYSESGNNSLNSGLKWSAKAIGTLSCASVAPTLTSARLVWNSSELIGPEGRTNLFMLLLLATTLLLVWCDVLLMCCWTSRFPWWWQLSSKRQVLHQKYADVCPFTMNCQHFVHLGSNEHSYVADPALDLDGFARFLTFCDLRPSLVLVFGPSVRSSSITAPSVSESSNVWLPVA